MTVPYGADCTLTETPHARYLTADLDDAASGITSPAILSVSNTAKAMTLDLTKSASASTVRPGTSVTYTVTVENKGNYLLPAAEFTVTDDTCSPLTNSVESISNDNILQVGEVWTYNCAKVLNADTTKILISG